MNPSLGGVSSEWVKLCPYLGVTPPHPLVAEQDKTAKEVQEIYEYFRQENPKEPFQAFIEHYTTLAKEPKAFESKFQQVKNSVGLLKVIRQARLLEHRSKKQLNSMKER